MTVSTKRFDNPFLVVHRFESPQIGGGEGVNSYILETENNLILVDLPLLDSVAQSLRVYADQLAIDEQRPLEPNHVVFAVFDLLKR